MIASRQAEPQPQLVGLPAADKLELNCNGLSFCSQSGTGRAALEGQPAQQGLYSTVAFPGGSLDPTTGVGEVIGPDTPAGLLGTLTQGGRQEFSLFSNVDGGSATSQFRSPPGSGMLVDSAGDQPASAANTITFTVDLTGCMNDKGQTFPVGQPVMFDISANSQSSSDHSNQKFWLERTR